MYTVCFRIEWNPTGVDWLDPCDTLDKDVTFDNYMSHFDLQTYALRMAGRWCDNNGYNLGQCSAYMIRDGEFAKVYGKGR